MPICKHGNLDRQCLICELEEELRRVKNENKRLAADNEAYAKRFRELSVKEEGK